MVKPSSFVLSPMATALLATARPPRSSLLCPLFPSPENRTSASSSSLSVDQYSPKPTGQQRRFHRAWPTGTKAELAPKRQTIGGFALKGCPVDGLRSFVAFASRLPPISLHPPPHTRPLHSPILRCRLGCWRLNEQKALL
ncbi:hypothetical protein C8R46DRAFT_221757 [Mycena filopes]|nr:hypothetical protein C8R46DRAFT_221757 [Mycena filopes]